MNSIQPTEQWSENVIIADGDYIDDVAFNLIVNFERMIERRIPQADTARWIDCIALDGGLKEGEHETQVIFIHSPEKKMMKNFIPGNYEEELNAKAFKDNLGEFTICSYPVEKIVKKDEFILDILRTAVNHKDVKRIMLIANMENAGMVDMVRHDLRNVDEDKRITVFAMLPLAGGNFRQEILGYSLMAALGIRGEEIHSS